MTLVHIDTRVTNEELMEFLSIPIRVGDSIEVIWDNIGKTWIFTIEGMEAESEL